MVWVWIIRVALFVVGLLFAFGCIAESDSKKQWPHVIGFVLSFAILVYDMRATLGGGE